VGKVSSGLVANMRIGLRSAVRGQTKSMHT